MHYSRRVQIEDITQPGRLAGSVKSKGADDMAHHTSALDESGSAPLSLPAEGGSFFSDFAPQLWARPVRTPSQLNDLSRLKIQPYANRLFEKLRQVVLQQNVNHFGKLDARTQALARLGGLLVMYREEFGDHIYQFKLGDDLIAVLDRPKGKFWLKRQLRGMDFSSISTQTQSQMNPGPHDDFERISVQDAVWLYAKHDPEAMLDLPHELGIADMQLRKLPKVSAQYLGDADLLLIRQLALHPQCFDQVREKTQLALQLTQLRTLACLYLTRCITVSGLS